MTQSINPRFAFLEGDGSLPPCSRLLGCRVVDIDVENSTLKLEFQGKPEFANPTGVIQGGMVAAMLDDVMGPCVGMLLEDGKFGATIEFKVNFIRPAQVGLLIGTARLVNKGKSVCFVESRLEDADGKLIATATASASVVSPESRSAAGR